MPPTHRWIATKPRHLLSYLADQASIALDNAYLHQALGRQGQQLEWLVDHSDRQRGAREPPSGPRPARWTGAIDRRLLPTLSERPSLARQASRRRRGASLPWAFNCCASRSKRRASSSGNCAPPGSTDFGLVQALRLYTTRPCRRWPIGKSNWLSRPAGASGSPPGSLAKGTASSLFRIVQEASTNARKYARSPRLRIALDADDETLWVRIRDWGEGFDPAKVPPGRRPRTTHRPGRHSRTGAPPWRRLPHR